MKFNPEKNENRLESKNNIIYPELLVKDIQLESKHFTGAEWLDYLYSKKILFDQSFEKFLLNDFAPEEKKDVTTKIALFKGEDIAKIPFQAKVVDFTRELGSPKLMTLEEALSFIVLVSENQNLNPEKEPIYLEHNPFSTKESKNSSVSYKIYIDYTRNTKELCISEYGFDLGDQSFRIHKGAKNAVAYEIN